MLTTLRNSSKNSILKIIFGTLLTVLIISFGMWGTEDLVGVSQKQSSVATVGKIDISSREFYSLYSRQTEEIRKLLGSSLDIKKSREFGYVDRALSSLINRALFNNEASELGLSVSDINVRDKILKDDAFKDDLGQFSELVFRQLISESGYTEDSYVEGSRQDLAREQMVETISSSLIIPKIMKNKLSEYSLEERSVDYITLKVEDEILTNPEENQIKEIFKSEILLEKGKEAVFDLQDELEDLLASGNNFEEISKLLEVKMIVASDIDNTGRAIDGNQNKEFKDERILRTIFNQKLNEEGNIIDIDKDEGLAISIVTKITPPRQLSLEEARKDVVEKLVFDLKLQKALKKAEMIKNKVANGDKFEVLAKSYNLNIKGVKPFTRILPDSSDLPIPLISKIFDSKIGEVNFEKRGGNEIVVVRTAEILNTLSENQTEKTEFSKKIRDDLTIDLLAQFSEALRKKYKITINDDVIDQLN